MTDSNTIPGVDLAIVVDTHAGLREDAVALSEGARGAIEAALNACPCDLQATWLGVEGIWQGTRFSRTLRNYLSNCGVSDSELLRLKSPRNTRNDPARGDGAEAIDYLCRYFNWRDRATRAIFYLGDGALGGGDRPPNPVDVELCDRAIAAAKSAGVVVHTYFGNAESPHREEFRRDYARLAEQTGGLSYVAPPDEGGFSAILEAVICGSLSPSYSLEMTKPLPCFELIGSKPRFGTNRVETVAIAATNCYTNVTFRDVTVFLSAVTVGDRTPVPNLPGEIPAIVLQPNTPIHFGDLPPCNPDISPSPATTTREIRVETRGNITGEFWLNIDYTYSAEFDCEGRVNCPVHT